MLSNRVRIQKEITFPFVKVSSVLPKEEINKLLSDIDSKRNELLDAQIGDGRISEVRKSKAFLQTKNEANSFLFEKMNNAISAVNAEFYDFDLDGYDFYQYAEYYGSNEGKYDFHMDTILDMINSNDDSIRDGTRKLSATLLLSEPNIEFTGGDFVLGYNGEKNPTKVDMSIGDMVVFPSFIMHSVQPVTSGVRKSAVVWVLGPKFR